MGVLDLRWYTHVHLCPDKEVEHFSFTAVLLTDSWAVLDWVVLEQTASSCGSRRLFQPTCSGWCTQHCRDYASSHTDGTLSDINHSCAEIFQPVYSNRSQVKAGNCNCESFYSFCGTCSGNHDYQCCFTMKSKWTTSLFLWDTAVFIINYCICAHNFYPIKPTVSYANT